VILRKKNEAGGITLSYFKLYYEAVVTTTVWCWHKNTHGSMEQNRKSINRPCIHVKLIYNKGAENIQWGKDSLFNKGCWENCACK